MPCPPDKLLIHGLYRAGRAGAALLRRAGERRTDAFTRAMESLGITSYEWVDGRGRGVANYLLRRMRGTARPVDAIEIMSANEARLRAVLESERGRSHWRQLAGIEAAGIDSARSFVLMGSPIHLLQGEPTGQRVLWFGNGQAHLSERAFVEHYTTRHGPLVAGHARAIGLRNYLQVPAEQVELCDTLRELGFGRATPPAVFAQLIAGVPPLKPSMWRARRAANLEIEADEQRHISFPDSMLMLAASPPVLNSKKDEAVR